MQTKDLKIGMHIAWSYQTRNSYGDNQEAFIMAFRPRGTTYGSVGNRTVGIARTWGRYDDNRPQSWSYEWISPAQVKQTWEAELIERDERQKRVAERALAEKRAKALRRKSAAEVPQAFFSALGITEDDVEDLIRGYRSSAYIRLENIAAAFKVAQNSHPDVQAKIVADEVAAALSLL